MVISNLSVECSEIEPDLKPAGETHHIFDVSLGAHPGGGDYRTYVLEKIDNRHWKLWVKIFVDEWEPSEIDDEHGAWLFGQQASCETNSDDDLTHIAKFLVAQTWAEEPNLYGTDFSDLTLEHAGLLSSLDGLKPIQCEAP